MNATMPALKQAFEAAGFEDVKTVLAQRQRRLQHDAGAGPGAGAQSRSCHAGARGREVFTAYVRSPRGPVFMTPIEKTFGKDFTTRTWETVEKIAT